MQKADNFWFKKIVIIPTLNFTNCKAFAGIWDLMLKTQWKLFNSTRKQALRLDFNIFPLSFQLVEKS